VRIERHENGVTEITTGDVHIISRKTMKQPHGQAPDSSSLQTMHDDQQLFWQELTDIALGRYFLLIAWAALYLALGNAQQRRAAEWREAEYRRAAKAAELRSLRYQVNPPSVQHAQFLSALVMVGRAEEAERMIQTISSFYRHSLTTDPTADVPLVDEISSGYLAIEGPLPERLRVEFDVPANVEQACVPGMILQPLVENSIKYAVSAATRPVTIRIHAQALGDLLVLSVADDGPGLPPGDHRTAGGTGIGLANVRSRLAARFGAQARVESGPFLPGAMPAY
jgi:LytS/YehU family sensor histidine kinase